MKNTNRDYMKTFNISSDIYLIYSALVLKINDWWGILDGNANAIGDIFKIKFGGEAYWKFEVIDLIANERVVWKCVESNQDHNIQGMDKEWLNSIITWKLTKSNKDVIVKFQHEGLKPSGVCYEVCSTAWDFYLSDSLKNYLEVGKGKPNGI